MATLPDLQIALRSEIIDLAPGHPALALLPSARLAAAAAIALPRDGALALGYGAEQGPGGLIEQLRARLWRLEGRELAQAELMVTGGVSQALDLLCTLYTQPGDVVLVESPVYHLALRIFRDHGLRLRAVPTDADGLLVEGVAEALEQADQAGVAPRFLYTVPTFGNPSGATLPLARRESLVALAAERGLMIVEDDVYRELWYDRPPPPALANLAPAGTVVRLGSFSKVLAPGLRLGWLQAAPAVVTRCTGSGLLDSGGGVNHFTGHIVSALMEQGWLDENVETLRAAYRARRDALAEALGHALPPGCHCVRPGGGFFTWLQAPDGLDMADLQGAAERAGVSYVPGARFFGDGGGQRWARLAFSLYNPEELAQGARRLGSVLRAALAQRS